MSDASSARPEIRGRANKNLSEILRAMRVAGQVRVAELMGCSESAVSRMKDGTLPDLAALLAACGLKVVPESFKTYAPDRIAALTTLAREALSNDGPESAFGGHDE